MPYVLFSGHASSLLSFALRHFDTHGSHAFSTLPSHLTATFGAPHLRGHRTSKQPAEFILLD
eukprot:scaffold167980_cov33-Tisochrysis_lutea.AAC.3